MSYILSEAAGRCVWVDEPNSNFMYDGGGGTELAPNSSNAGVIANNNNNNGTVAMTTTIDALDMIVESARLKFVAFLEAENLSPSSLPHQTTTSCYNYYRQCLFADAHDCIRDELESWRTFLIYLPFAVLLVLTAFIFNGLSVYFVSRNKNKLPRHAILQNLAVSDTLLSAFTLFKRSNDFLPYSIGSPAQMPFMLVNKIWQACWIVSCLGVLLLSLDCFAATNFPFFYRNPKTRFAINILMAFIWILAIVVTALLAFFDISHLATVQYVMCSIMVVILIVVFIDCIYVFMLAERVRRQQQRFFYDDRHRIRQLSNNRKRSLATIAIIIASTFICWLPLLTFFMFPKEEHEENIELSNQFLAVCLICFHINAIVNPIIYSFRFKDVRIPMQRNFSRSNIFLLKPIGRLLRRSGTSSTIASLGGFIATNNEAARSYLASTRHRHSDPNSSNHRNLLFFNNIRDQRRNSSSQSSSTSSQNQLGGGLFNRGAIIYSGRNSSLTVQRKMSLPVTLLSTTIPTNFLIGSTIIDNNEEDNNEEDDGDENTSSNSNNNNNNNAGQRLLLNQNRQNTE